MANIARPTRIWDQTLNDWVFLAGVVDTTKSYTYTADQTFPGITATSINSGPIVGRNKILNGDFSIWQRGTSFTSPADNGFVADRWRQNGDGTKGTRIWSRQSFAPGEISGYDAQYYMRFQQSVAGSGASYQNLLIQPIEDVRTFAGKTVTLSYWAKADTAGRTLAPIFFRFYGTGSPTSTDAVYGSIATLSTSWQRYTTTVNISSVVGKTISSTDHVFQLIFTPTFNIAQTIDIWGIQLEEGPVATPFSTATGNLTSELAACQRYYYVLTNWNGFIDLSTRICGSTQYPVEMRANPSFSKIASSTLSWRASNADISTTNWTLGTCTPSTKSSFIEFSVPGGTSSTVGYGTFPRVPYQILEVSAEL